MRISDFSFSRFLILIVISKEEVYPGRDRLWSIVWMRAGLIKANSDYDYDYDYDKG